MYKVFASLGTILGMSFLEKKADKAKSRKVDLAVTGGAVTGMALMVRGFGLAPVLLGGFTIPVLVFGGLTQIAISSAFKASGKKDSDSRFIVNTSTSLLFGIMSLAKSSPAVIAMCGAVGINSSIRSINRRSKKNVTATKCPKK